MVGIGRVAEEFLRVLLFTISTLTWPYPIGERM